MEKVYKNARTGEIVEEHRAAVEMFRAGDNVEVLKICRDSFGVPCFVPALSWEH